MNYLPLILISIFSSAMTVCVCRMISSIYTVLKLKMLDKKIEALEKEEERNKIDE